MREIEKRLGIAGMLSACVPDARDQSRVIHSHADMIGARMIASYEDCDDLDTLRIDPAFKMACGRRPATGQDLMPQPTLSRLENAPSWRSLARMAFGMIDLFCASFSRVPGRIVLDIDDTDEALAPRRSLWRTATFETLRRAFLKIAVRVEELKSRIKVAFPSAYPHAPVLALQ